MVAKALITLLWRVERPAIFIEIQRLTVKSQAQTGRLLPASGAASARLLHAGARLAPVSAGF